MEQTEDGSVDTTGYVGCILILTNVYKGIPHCFVYYSTDVLFFTVQPVNNEVISPHTVIR